jgi:hypothetical protein
MALVATTLARAKSFNGGFLNDTSLSLTAATGATTKMIGYVDAECFRITDVERTPTLGIVPGYTKSTAGPHAVGAPVVFGLPSDFIGIGGPQSLSFFTGAITGPGGAGTLPVVDTIIFLTASGAGAYTIALPAADQTNTLTILNATAQAHVLTLTGNPATSDVATWVAALGGMLRIRANYGVWAIEGNPGVIVA